MHKYSRDHEVLDTRFRGLIDQWCVWEQSEAYNRGRRSPADRVEWDGPSKQAAVHTVERQLTAVHESIIIGSPGLWGLASPDAAALRSHFYLRVPPSLLGIPFVHHACETNKWHRQQFSTVVSLPVSSRVSYSGTQAKRWRYGIRHVDVPLLLT